MFCGCFYHFILLFSLSRILWKKNEVADYEATTFAIFYNNSLYLMLVLISSFFVLKSFDPNMYPFYIYEESEW